MVRALGVQAGLTSVANEVVVLVMVGWAGSTSARARGGRLIIVAGEDVDGSPCQSYLGWPG
jgi:hypothetical protein